MALRSVQRKSSQPGSPFLTSAADEYPAQGSLAPAAGGLGIDSRSVGSSTFCTEPLLNVDALSLFEQIATLSGDKVAVS